MDAVLSGLDHVFFDVANEVLHYKLWSFWVTEDFFEDCLGDSVSGDSLLFDLGRAR